MHETDTQTMPRDTTATETWTPAGRPDAQVREEDPAWTSRTASFAEGAETLPEDDADERLLHRGSFASGVEEMPAKNAEQRVHARGGFATGEEATPEEDAEARRRPGTFADSEPTA